VTAAPEPNAADRPDGLSDGLVLEPFRAIRPTADGPALAQLLCPPYDVIDATQRARLLEADPDNAVAVILPEAPDGGDPYQGAADRLDRWVRDGRFAVDHERAVYVYEMTDTAGATTRGLVGALQLRDPLDGVVLPHENTMAGPVADRLALMQTTDANVEMIYLVYDGGGPASDLVASVDERPAIADTVTPDGVRHRLWALRDAGDHETVRDDLSARRALIADGHHRYATYRELQQRRRAHQGPGPWDYGLTLLVDSTSYGPQVHAIHRVLPRLTLPSALEALEDWRVSVHDVTDPQAGLAEVDGKPGFAVVLADAARTVVLVDEGGALRDASRRDGEPESLSELDVTVLHRGLVERALGLADNEDTVEYAHSVEEAVDHAAAGAGIAVLLRPTPVPAVAAVAAAGARMPRKSTLFTPKPASGLIMRRFADAD
jgi:uncharacterized protein (DUF1015 family)